MFDLGDPSGIGLTLFSMKLNRNHHSYFEQEYTVSSIEHTFLTVESTFLWYLFPRAKELPETLLVSVIIKA